LYHSTLGLRVIKKMKKKVKSGWDHDLFWFRQGRVTAFYGPLSSEYGTNKTVKARLLVESLSTL